MDEITANEFKAKCLKILDRLPREGLAITKEGKIVAKIFPHPIDNSGLIGSKPDMKVNGDIYSTGVKWDASP